MAQTASFGQLVDPQEEAIQRQRQYAQALRQQAMQPMEQQVVSGRVVPFSITQGLASMLKAYAGRKGEEDADTQATELNTRKRTQGAAELQGIVQALRGTPAQAEVQGNNPSAYVPEQAAQAPDQNKALAMALQSQNPMAQQIGGTLLTSSLPKAPKMERVEVPDGNGGKRVGFVDMNSPNPMSTFQEGGTMPVKQEFVNGQAVNPYGAPTGMTIPKQLDPTDPRKDLLLPDGSGGFKPNAPLVGVKQGIAKAGASNVSLSTEKGYAGAMAKGLADQDLAAVDAARSAPQRVQAAQQVKRILDTQAPITGTGAEARLAVSKALATAGVIDGQGVKSTEDLASLLANQTLEAIKTSGLGSGQGFTDKDRAFLERAKSGNIEINSGTLRTLADLNEKSARESLKRGQQVANRIKGNKDFGSVGQDIPLEMPPEYLPPSVVRKPNAGGVKFLGFE